jgi:hypothetical protein
MTDTHLADLPAKADDPSLLTLPALRRSGS